MGSSNVLFSWLFSGKKGDVMQLCFCNSSHTAAVCLYFLFGVFEWLKATVELLLLLLHNACCLFFSLDDSTLVLWNGGKQVCGVTLKPVSILVWVPPPQLARWGFTTDNGYYVPLSRLWALWGRDTVASERQATCASVSADMTKGIPLGGSQLLLTQTTQSDTVIDCACVYYCTTITLWISTRLQIKKENGHQCLLTLVGDADVFWPLWLAISVQAPA